jgi:hypothetical protein
MLQLSVANHGYKGAKNYGEQGCIISGELPLSYFSFSFSFLAQVVFPWVLA